MEKLFIIDKLENKIFYDAHSIGIALIDPEASSLVQRKIRECLMNSSVILEFNQTKRAYILTESFVTYLSVELIENQWYVQSIDIEKKVSDIMEMMRKNTILFINEKILNAIK
jgi:hypothetical protein